MRRVWSSRRVLGLGSGAAGGRQWFQSRFGEQPSIGRIDSAMPQKRILSARLGMVLCSVRKGVAVRDRRKLSLAREHPADQPVVQRVSRYRANFVFLPLPRRRFVRCYLSAGPTLAPPAKLSALSLDQNSCSSRCCARRKAMSLGCSQGRSPWASPLPGTL